METANPPNPFHKQNGSELYCGGPQNGSLRCFQDDEEEDFGPETDVDAVDDVLTQPSSIAAAKALVSSSQNKEFEDDIERQRQQLSDFDDPADADRSTNTPTPPAGDVVGLPEAENVAESGGEGEDSEEEEWNYFKGEEKTKSPTKEELEEMESRLNPDAPVFVPESPLKTAHKNVDDIDISSSPLKGFEKSLENVPLPSQNDFHKGIMECAGEFDRINGVDANNKELIDEKNTATNNHGDESEILSTKAEFGDDSAFSFSVSMNTSTAFSSEIPNDDKENHSPSDLLFTSENDFDPSMDAPKELQDLVSSPEPEETQIPGTPHSTVAEASVSPANMDASPSNFMDFEKNDENIKGETVELSESDKADSDSNERDVDLSDSGEPQKQLTFAEVLKRPSPRTSPDLIPRQLNDEYYKSLQEPHEDISELLKETRAQIKLDMSEYIPKLPYGYNKGDPPVTGLNDVPEELLVTDSDEFVKSNEDKIQPTNAIINNGNDDGDNDEKLPDLDNLENSYQFVTVRKSPVDEHLVNFNELRTPDDEKPPQFFHTDELKNIPSVDAIPEKEIPLFVENTNNKFHEAAKAVCIEDDVPVYTLTQSEEVKAVIPDSLQFLSSIHSEDQSATDTTDTELESKMDQVDEIHPGDLQFGTIDSKIGLGDGFHFSEVKIDNLLESNSFAEINDLKVEENHFELKSTEINEIPLDFNESHFKGEIAEIHSNNSTDTYSESKQDAHEVATESHSNDSEFFHNIGMSVPPVAASPVTEPVELLGNLNTDHKQEPFQHDEVLFKNNDFSFENHDTLSNVLQNEISLPEKAGFQESNNPFLEEINQFNEKSANEPILSQVETLSNFDSGLQHRNEFAEVHLSESIIEPKNVDASLSGPLKQLEETLEQTINVDFIPAEPLGTLDAHLVSLTNVSKEELLVSEEKEASNVEETVKLEESVVPDVVTEVVPISQAAESIEESSKDLNLATGTPPPTPAPGVAEQKPEEKEGLLAAAAAAAVAGAAVTAGVAAAKTTTVKKSTTSVTAAKKPLSTTAPKKPTDLKTGTKTSSVSKTTAAPKPGVGSPSKPAAPSTARKSLTSSSAPMPKPSTKPTTTIGAKSSTTASKSSPALKPNSLTSKPSTPPSKPTTPTSASRPSSATKASPTKSTITARSTVLAAAKSKPSTVADKKPLMNGDPSKTTGKKPDATLPAKKPLTSTAPKLSTATTKPAASKTTTTSVTSKVGVSSALKTNSVPASAASKLKTTTNAKPASTMNATAKAKLPAKPTDKTVKETVNKQISSTASKVGTNKVPPSKTTTTSTTLKKTETKMSPGKTAVNKASPVPKKTTAVTKKETKSEELTQDHIITTTNGYAEELIKNEVEIVKDSSPLDNICDDTLAATN